MLKRWLYDISIHTHRWSALIGPFPNARYHILNCVIWLDMKIPSRVFLPLSNVGGSSPMFLVCDASCMPTSLSLCFHLAYLSMGLFQSSIMIILTPSFCHFWRLLHRSSIITSLGFLSSLSRFSIRCCCAVTVNAAVGLLLHIGGRYAVMIRVVWWWCHILLEENPSRFSNHGSRELGKYE